MADRGKVLRALKQHLLAPDVDECVGCPYFELEPHECERQLYRDVVELLKAQEPRVLTWDELMALPHGEETNAPVVSEVKYPINTWDEGTLCKWRGAEFIQEFVQDHSLYNRESYGKVWRCWTALPTRKQRKAVKWDG